MNSMVPAGRIGESSYPHAPAKNLDKPISKECAISCAKAGSALVIFAEDGTIYWPISDAMPSSGRIQSCFPSPKKK